MGFLKNLFDNWYVDWNFTAPTEWRKSDFTYTIYMEDDDGRWDAFVQFIER